MASERTQRQINRLLDEAESALAKREWQRVRDLASDTLALDPSNADARSFLAAAERACVSRAPRVRPHSTLWAPTSGPPFTPCHPPLPQPRPRLLP